MLDEIQKFRSAGGNVFLFVPSFDRDLERFEYICSEYFKKAFCADKVLLIILVDNMQQEMSYVWKWQVATSIAVNVQLICIKKMDMDLSLLMGNIDYYITDSSIESTIYIDKAYAHHVPCISSYENGIFSVIKENPVNLARKNKIKATIDKDLLEKYPLQEYEYILFHQGLGESVVFCYLLKEYKRIVNKKLLILCYDKSRASLVENHPYVDIVVTISPFIYSYIAVYMAKKYNIKNYLQEHFTAGTVPYHLYPFEESYRDLSIGEAKTFLGIPLNYTIERFPLPLPQEKIDYVRKLFRDLQLPLGKVVFLIMDGLSSPSGGVSNLFWKKLIEAIREKGYEPVIKSNKEVFYGVKFVFLCPKETTLFVELCGGNVISIPTGISYAIGMLSNKNICFQEIWTNMFEEWKENYILWNLDILSILRYSGDRRLVEKLIDENKPFRSLFGSRVHYKPYIWEQNDDVLINELIEGLE